MNTHKIIDTYMIQSNHLDVTEVVHCKAMGVNLKREHFVQALIAMKHPQNEVESKSWSELITMMNTTLNIDTN
jgi:hypothetical protein